MTSQSLTAQARTPSATLSDLPLEVLASLANSPQISPNICLRFTEPLYQAIAVSVVSWHTVRRVRENDIFFRITGHEQTPAKSETRWNTAQRRILSQTKFLLVVSGADVLT